jgi:hypothetical protein
MRSRRCLSTPAFEIYHSYHLKMLAITPMLHIAAAGTRILIKKDPHLLHLFSGVGSPPRRGDLGQRTLPFKRQVSKIPACDTEVLGNFAQLKFPQTFHGARWKHFQTVLL